MPVILVIVSATLSAISPLLMAVVNPDWSYWYMAFIAQVGGIILLNDLSKLPHRTLYVSKCLEFELANINLRAFHLRPSSPFAPMCYSR